jgi:hypothetical protein
MITIERNGKRLLVNPEELQDDDIITGGVLAGGAHEPVAVATHVKRLTLRDGNFKNVLLTQPVTLADVDGTVREYPAAPHTAHWVVEGGLVCYGLRSVEDARQAAMEKQAELLGALSMLKEKIPALNKTAENPAVLSMVQDALVESGLTKPELNRLGAKLPDEGGK